jgi:thiol-disulfide isomerase/thioredoxin
VDSWLRAEVEMTGPRNAAPVEITIVQAPGCHFCDDALETIQALAADYPVSLRLVEVRSDQGLRLVALHRPGMNPLVLVNGDFFSAGRLPRGKLRKLLDRLVADRLVAGRVAPDRSERVG